MSSRQRLEGASASPAATRGSQYAPRDLYSLPAFPSQSILTEEAFECGNIAHSPLNIFKAIGALVFVALTGLSIFAGFFLCLFVEIH